MIALIIAALAVSLLAVMLFPVNVSFNSVRSGGSINGGLHVSWIIFLFRYALKEKQLEIQIFGRSIFRQISPEKKPPEPEPERERKKSPPVKDILNMSGPMLRFFKDLVHAIRIKYLDVHVTFGMKDPAYTGIMTGFLHAAGLSRTGHNISWRPDFTGQVLNWDLSGRVALTPVRVIPPLARFVTNRKVLTSGWRMIMG